MTLTEQYTTSTDQWLVANRDDMVAITYTTGNIDGTQVHVVRETAWISGNVGRQLVCSTRGSIRAISLGHAPAPTCQKCIAEGYLRRGYTPRAARHLARSAK